ncbi:hypothetical protein L210DRAFT_438563 [Boletus edulis BED1]|uniref:Uncharacterized protein n=1 Tax=Boletus edulis BED1 TaxID=1328754 RepID=A0AAD4BXH0_BOLED|nr:hypothetical protein L210DRAFT_438563 [Boletus edulis BED1]
MPLHPIMITISLGATCLHRTRSKRQIRTYIARPPLSDDKPFFGTSQSPSFRVVKGIELYHKAELPDTHQLRQKGIAIPRRIQYSYTIHAPLPLFRMFRIPPARVHVTLDTALISEKHSERQDSK